MMVESFAEEQVMPSGQAAVLIRHVQRFVGPPTVGELTDGRLLQRFVLAADEMAFAALVQRHAALVFGVCRRVLRDRHDAEDAFQATFLVLARKATSIHKQDSVGSWLYGVAYRVARQARASAARRQVRERRVDALPASHAHTEPTEAAMSADPISEVSRRELCSLLDQELIHLPEKYRAPLVLCFLQGQTHTQAAQQLAWAVGTLKSRLTRGCALLRGRLQRHGVVLSGVAVTGLLTEQGASAGPPVPVLHATIKAALQYAAEPAATGLASTPVVALAEAVLKTTALRPMQAFAAVMLAVTLIGAGRGWFQQPAATAQEAAPAAAPAERPRPALPRVDAHGDALPPNVLARLGTIRWRHGAAVTQVAFGPDGRTLITASSDGTVRVWDRSTGRELRRLDATGTVAFSSDATLLATRGSDDWIHVRELATGKEVHKFKAAPTRGMLLFSPDHKYLAGTTDEQAIVVYAIDGGKELVRIKAEANPNLQDNTQNFAELAFAPDGKRLAALETGIEKNGNFFSRLCLYDVKTGKEAASIGTPAFGVTGLTYTPDGKHVAFASTEKIHVHDAGTGKAVRSFPGHDTSVAGFVFAPDGQSVFVKGSLTRRIHHRDTDNGKLLREFGGPDRPGDGMAIIFYGVSGPGGDLAVSSDGKQVAAGGEDSAIRLWDAATGKESVVGAGHQTTVTTVATTPDGKTLFTVGDDGTFRCWDLATSKELHRFVGPHGVTCVAFAPDGRSAAVGGVDRCIHVLDPATGKVLRSLPAHAGGVAALSWSPDGKLLAARGPADNLIRLLDPTAGKELRRIDMPANRERPGNGLDIDIGALANAGPGLAFAPDSSTIASLAAEGTLRLWEVATGMEVRHIKLREGNTRSYVFAPDGRSIAVENADTTVSLYEIASGKERLRVGTASKEAGDDIQELLARTIAVQTDGSTPVAPRCAFSPDGRTLAASGSDRRIHIWDVAGGRELRQLQGHQGEVVTLAFGSGGQTLVSGSRDTMALVWDVANLSNELRQQSVELPPAQMEALWKSLGAEADAAYKAITTLATAPGSTVPFLRTHLQPVAPVEEKRLKQLIADLEDNKLAVRQQARNELESLGGQARSALMQVLDRQPPLELRQRVEGVLRAIVAGPLTPEQLRQDRAIEVLERVGSADARQVLEMLAQGAAGARLTSEAAAALGRLRSR
jgi:RNA polymerase sigma factor (sigma-70 family)